MIRKLFAPAVTELRGWATYHLLMWATRCAPAGESRIRLAKLVCAYLKCEALAIKIEMQKRSA